MKRRNFMKTVSAGLILPSLQSYAMDYSQFENKRVGLIGSGWYGKSALLRLLQVAPVQVVALCDVDEKMVNEAAELVAPRQESKKKPRTYEDYHEMLEKEDLDIVQVSTPDHWHALAMIDAVKAGADVFVEKPISVDVVEGQAMLAAARKYDRVVQVNTERRSTPHLIDARDKVIRTGKLGKIGHVEIYCYYHMRARGNPEPTDPPEHFNYDLWCGPAPKRPYVPVVHPRSWRSFMEYSNGIIGDMCIHMYDMIRWMLDLGWPKTITSNGGILIDKESIANISDTQTAVFDHDDLTVAWQHRTWGHSPDPEYPWGATIYGDKGTLKLSVMKYEFTPRGEGESIKQDVVYELEEYPEDKDEKDLEKHVAPALRRHMKDFLKAIDQRTRPVSDIEEGFISSASCILSNLAMKTGKAVHYDPKKGKTSDDELNALLQREYRDPWVHPTPDSI